MIKEDFGTFRALGSIGACNGDRGGFAEENEIKERRSYKCVLTSTGLLVERVHHGRNQIFGTGSVSRCRDQTPIHPLQYELAHLR